MTYREIIRKCVNDKENEAAFAFWLVIALVTYSATITALYFGVPVYFMPALVPISMIAGAIIGALIASEIYPSERLAEAECRALFEPETT